MPGFYEILGSSTSIIMWVLIGAVLIFGAIIITILLHSFIKFNHSVVLYTKTRGGEQYRRLKGGYVRNPKTKKIEFRLLKPRLIIDNFNREWVVPAIKRFAKPEAYCFLQRDNKVIQLETSFNYPTDSGKLKELNFISRSLGKDRFAEEFDKDTESMFSYSDFLSKHGEKIFWMSILTIQLVVIMMLFRRSGI